MLKKRGFTAAEMLVVMVILGVIAAIMIPMVKNNMPNEEQVMFKKAYNLAGRVISELINDSDYYWESGAETDGYGFANTSAGQPVDGQTMSGDTKFCELFASTLNTLTTANCTEQSQFAYNTLPGNGTFKTNDGMVWQLPITNFGGKDATTSNYYNIVVDVNGDKGGNCFDSEEGCNKPDRFIIQFNNLGSIKVPGTLEKEYLRSNKTTKSYKTILSEKGTGYLNIMNSTDGVKTLTAALDNTASASGDGDGDGDGGDGDGDGDGGDGGDGGTE